MKMMRWPLFLAPLILLSCNDPVEKAGDEPTDGGNWIELGPASWKPIVFGGEGITEWKDEVLSVGAGVELSGVLFDGGELPSMPYELELEARKISGSDFFCGLTFPVSSKEECVSLILGGWGGGTVGISSIDNQDASENETTFYEKFDDNRWYAIRVVVEADRLQAFLDGKSIADVKTTGRKLGLRAGTIEASAPLGLTTFQTSAEIRGIRWRSLAE